MSVDLVSVNNEAGADGAADRQAALKALLMIDDVADCGIDVAEKLYGFETADGEFGLVAKVNSKPGLEDWLGTLVEKGVCKRIGEKRGYDFFTFKESFLISYSGDALIVMGPVVGGDLSRKQIQMAKYLDADDGEGVMQSKMFERLEQMGGPVALVARSSALPEKFTAPVALGAPKGTDAAEVLISADMSAGGGVLNVAGEVFSFNASVDEALKKASGSYRPINGTFLNRIPAAASFALMANVRGADYLRLLRSNEALRAMLMGINTAIDIDKMITSVDGDMLITASAGKTDRMAVRMMATVGDSGWTSDVDYWKKSCPPGTVITESGAGGNLPQYYMSGSSADVWFGMADAKTMYISTDAAVKSAADAVAVPKDGLAPAVIDRIKAGSLCIIVNLDGLSHYKQEMSVATSILRPLFGDVHTLVYTLR